ncbi:MAG: helix-turn-helix transcriptional regulator [Cystobacter sp.]
MRTVRAARDRCKLTQSDVAERIGVDPEVFGRLERGKFIPRVTLLRKLAVVLNVSVDNLLGLDIPGALVPRIGPPPEESLPPETRRVLRSVRELAPAMIKILTTTGFAMLEAKVKRRRHRARVGSGRRAGGR